MWFIIWRRNFGRTLFNLLVVAVLISGIMTAIRGSIPTSSQAKNGFITLIIDDFGNYGDGTLAILKLGIPITAAVMPFLEHSRSDADLAHEYGQEVILHLPMEAKTGQLSWLGPRPIVTKLSTEQIQTQVREGLAQISWAVGVNNHMGSKAMEDSRVVRAVLEVIREKNLIFVDSRTTERSAAPQINRELNLPYLSRNVFLELTKDKASIIKQLQKLGDIALAKGYAIGIGHVGHDGGSVTAAAIRDTYPELQARGIQFIPLLQMRAVVLEHQSHGQLTGTERQPKVPEPVTAP